MKIPVSTKVEKAWYVDPDLYANEAEAEAALDLSVEPTTLPRNETLTLNDKDFEAAPEVEGTDGGSRYYKDVALKGAIIAPEDQAGRRAAPEVATSLHGRPGLGEIGGRAADAFKGAAARASVVFKAATARASVVFELFEEGKVPPIWLAAIAFFAGVVTTLIGVLIAL
jgi:hypothetical protein